jgi:hypothetical protein
MPLYTFAPAKNRRDVLDAWSLVHDRYCEEHYVSPHSTGIHTSSRAIGEQAMVAVARLPGGAVSGTMTMVVDRPGIGLPLDDVYGADLDGLRARGMRLAEVGLHAGHPPDRNREFGLYRLITWWGRHEGGTVMVAGINPDKHRTFFCGVLGFEPIVDEVRKYRAVNGAAVLPVWCSVDRLRNDERCRFARKVLGDEILESEYADRYLFPADEVTACPRLAPWIAAA